MIDQYGYYMSVLQDLVVGGLLVCGLWVTVWWGARLA